MVQPVALTQRTPGRAQPLVEALLATWRRDPADPLLAIDPRDEMLAFLRDVYLEDPEQALCAYYRSGHEIADVLLQALRWRFGETLAQRSVLDFASGYGRVTRFLLAEIPAERLFVTDVLAEAIAFQGRAFGVGGVASALRPDELTLEGTFDAVTVTSLFTHLPEARFRAWLVALWARVRRGGVLLFSTHDATLHPVAEERRRELVFEPISESRSLALTDYGTTWVSEAFVRGAVAGACPGASAFRLPRALCNFQDLWIVVPEAGARFEGLTVHGEPEVMVERCTVADGELSISGWAVTRHGQVERVELAADGAPLAVGPVGAPCPHVADALGERFLRSGWSCRAPLGSVVPGDGTRGAGEGTHRPVLVLGAVDGRGVAHVARLGTLDALLASFRADQVRGLEADLFAVRGELDSYRAHAEHELAGLRARIAAMQASRFWKLRNAWFAVKRALGLTVEP